MPTDPEAGEFAFGRFRLDVGKRALRRDGAHVPLGTRSIDILCALTESAGALVTKDDLMERIWRGVVVEDNTLQVHVSALRKALGEGDGGPRYILTVPGQGYRFVCERERQFRPESIHDAPMLPDRPSIAVLPFENMSAGTAQDYFADGVVEDVITALTRFPQLFVIARNSSFTYKGQSVDVRQVGRELGVRYVLEGSVRRSEERLRITGQLIEAETGSHLWADRFDGRLADVFDLQDEVAARVVGAIVPQLERAEIERTRRKPTASLRAYDYYLRGLASYHRETIDENEQALLAFTKTLELDREFATAYAMAAMCYSQRKRNGWPMEYSSAKAEAKRLAWRAAELGKDDAAALSMAGIVLGWIAQEVDEGMELINRALDINPNLATAWSSSAWVHAWKGESDLAIEHAERSMRLNPLEPVLPAMEYAIALAHFAAARYDLAASWAEKAAAKLGSNLRALRILAASHALAGRLERARNAVARIRLVWPSITISDVMIVNSYQRPDDQERFMRGLRLAGLPE
jgi:TolB-like protein/tetratricopeptide (TPR) repeat protein